MVFNELSINLKLFPLSFPAVFFYERNEFSHGKTLKATLMFSKYTVFCKSDTMALNIYAMASQPNKSHTFYGN